MNIDTHIDTLLQELDRYIVGNTKGFCHEDALNEHIHALSVYVAIESRTEEEKEAIKRKSQENPSREMIEQILLEYICRSIYGNLQKTH